MHHAEVFNLNQKEAVSHVEGPLLVLAGAGSGKTRVVTGRIAHLLEKGVPASDILAVTFTNKAAEVMRERVRAMTSQHVLTCTFHSLAARILRESIHEIGYQNTFSIYDEKESEEVLKQALSTLGYKDQKPILRPVRHQISEAKNALTYSEDIADPLVRSAYALYQKTLKEYNALDFDDLLFLTIELFRNSPDAVRYQKRWSFLLIDEYQDTNKAQYEMSRFLVEKHGNLFVVGDPDQSIYSWRGARMENILNFERDFPAAKTITLSENYRSTNAILKAANALIGNNNRAYEKDLWSNLGEGEKVSHRIYRTDREEAEATVEQIRTYAKRYPYEEIAILYRTNSQSRLFEDQFLKYKIPYTIIGGFSFYQRREIKDVMAYLRLILSPSDFISFERVINLPKRGIGPKALEKLRQASEGPIIHTCKRVLRGEFGSPLSKVQEMGLMEFCTLLDRGRQMVEGNRPLHEIIKMVIYDSRYLEFLKEDPETYKDRKENVEELVGTAMQWENEAKDPSLLAFLEELSLKSSTDVEEKQKSSVRLMTIHSSKGMEFNVCFIVGMEEDLFPHINTKNSPQEIEEERRLCYVGMTRAKHHLHLSSASYRILFGTPRNQTSSRFLRELPADLILRELHRSGGSDLTSDEQVLQPGTTVYHKQFGQGVVERVHKTSLGLTYDVSFAEGSRRSLVAKYAKLTT